MAALSTAKDTALLGIPAFQCNSLATSIPTQIQFSVMDFLKISVYDEGDI